MGVCARASASPGPDFMPGDGQTKNPARVANLAARSAYPCHAYRSFADHQGTPTRGGRKRNNNGARDGVVGWTTHLPKTLGCVARASCCCRRRRVQKEKKAPRRAGRRMRHLRKGGCELRSGEGFAERNKAWRRVAPTFSNHLAPL
jgi:hypothetical protein